ncbi:sulfatase-like hydrolase/transferase, partial [Luteolibacter algae]
SHVSSSLELSRKWGQATHSVLAATEADLEVFPNLEGKRKTYAAMVYAMDRGIGRIVEALKENGSYENTLIIFMSDNGGRTDEGATNEPLRGVKGDTYEGGFRVPMLVHWAGKVPSGRVYDQPVSALDLYPTFTQLAGANVPDGKDLDGTDIWNDFLAGQSARKGGMIYSVRYQNGYTDVGARIDDWKVTRHNREWKLFNITKDLGESNDLAGQYPERLQQMVKQVQKYAESHVQPLWFDSPEAEKKWHAADMPNYEKTFEPN